MRIVIVDDEPFARSRIVHLLQQADGMEIVAQCSNGASAIHAINEHQPDLVFLDINIRDMDGFQVLEQIHARPQVVFVTAHEDFAVKAFEYEAFDYLVKPFSEERFFRTLQKLIKAESTEHLRKIAVKRGSRTVLLPTEDIHYILASGVYAEIFTEGGKYVHRESLSNLEQELNPQHFFRVHRSAIVNLGEVRELVHGESGGIEVRMPDGALVGVSKTQRKAFLHKIKA